MGEGLPFAEIVAPEVARARLFAAWHPAPGGTLPPDATPTSSSTEQVDLAGALGRVLATDVVAGEDLPAFARSTVDGYAVRAADTFGAGEGLPAYLTVAGAVEMGQAPALVLRPGEAAWIPTGGMLPGGADAVVMVEHTERLGPHEIEVKRPAGPGENVLRAGEDVVAGSIALPAGCTLRPQELGLLAGLGITRVAVRTAPAVAILSTGDEVVPPEARPGPGQIRDINTTTLAALVAEAGGRPVVLGIIPDTLEAMMAALGRALERADLVLISGGSSVGPRDLVARAIDGAGPPGVVVRGVAMKPGKPTILAVVGGKAVVGLPGHPTTVMIVFHVFVREMLDRLLGRISTPARSVQARLARRIASAPGREDYLRVRLEVRGDELWAVPLLGKSGLLMTMVRADGLARIPADQEGVDVGESVEVQLWPR